VASYLFRLLQNRKNHPAAYNKLVPVIQQFLQPTLPNPASTPRDQAPTPLSLSAQYITQEEEPDSDGQADQHENSLVEPHDQSTPAVHHRHENLFVDPHDHGPPAVKQEPSQGGRPSNHTYIEDADDSGAEQTSDVSQRLANLDIWPPSDHNDDTYNEDVPQD
jgi:hypothetical protein